MRNQAAMNSQAHNQGQVQQQSLQQNPSQFSNIAVMNGMNQGQQSQSPAMQNQQRPVMPPQMGFNNGNQVFPQNPTQLVPRNSNPAMLLQNAPPNAMNGITPNVITRQLGLLGTARNQQPQNGPGPMRLPQHFQQGNNNQTGMQGQTSFQPPQTMFQPTAPNVVRGSPAMQQAAAPAVANTTASAQQAQIQQMSHPYFFGVGNTRLPPEETARKVAQLKEELAEKEARFRSMNPRSNENLPMLRELIQDIQMNRALHLRLMAYLQKAAQQGVLSVQALQKAGILRNDQAAPNQSGQPNMYVFVTQPMRFTNSLIHRNNSLPQQHVNISQQPSQHAPPQNSPNWQQGGPNAYGGQQNFNNQQPAPPVQSQGTMPNGPSNMNQFLVPPNINRQPTPLSQTSSPHQMMHAIMNRQGPGHTSPQPGQGQGPNNQMQSAVQQSVSSAGMAPQQQQLGSGPVKRQPSPPPTIPPGMIVPPLETSRFLNGLDSFLKRKGMNLDRRLLSIDNRQIDLHALHTETMRLGGPATVSLFF